MVAVAVVLVVQLLHLADALDDTQPLTAGHAEPLVLGYALTVVGIASLAGFLPRRRLWVPVSGSGVFLAVMLVGTLGVGGQLWAFLWALLSLTCCWQMGAWTFRALRVPRLADVPAVALVGGLGIVGLVLLGLGRAGLLSWLTIAVPVAIIGVAGAVQLGRLLGAGGLRRAWNAATSTRVGTASVAICVVTGGLALVWTAAPEMGYDALYYKAWLPSEWASTGHITPLLIHPVLNFFGFAQLLAIPGHIAGAGAVGRYLEWLVYGLLAGTVWWSARRSPWAPVAAAVLVVTPQLFWEATTAYDDIFLALGGVATAIAVVRLVNTPALPPFLAGVALGLLAATCLNLKIHIAPLAAGLVLGWLLVRGRSGVAPALGGAVLGAVAFAAPPLVLRWVDTGNPVLPSYNAIFHSPYWLPNNPSLGFPRLEDPGSLGPITTLWTTVARTSTIDSYAPVGALGLLTMAVAVALLACGRLRRADRSVVAVWVGVLVGAISWYVQFRNTRYALPVGTVAVLLIGLAAGKRSPSRRAEGLTLAALAATAVLLWPSTISQFFYVPGKDIPWRAAIGATSDRGYENDATAARAAVAAFDRLAPPGALAASDASQRAWLTDGRDFTPFWELDTRIRIAGPHPDDPAETLRRVRAAGVQWVLTYHNGVLSDRLAYLRRMVQTYGKSVWHSPVATVYRLPDA